MTIPTNTPVTLTVTGQGGSLWNVVSLGLSSGVTDLQTAIITALNGAGLPGQVNIAATNLIPAPTWPFSGTIIVRPTYDIDDADLRSQVEQAVETATNGNAASVAIQAIGNASNPIDPNAPTPSALPKWLADFLAALQSDAKWIAVGAVGLVALTVVGVAYGPNIKSLAKDLL